MAGINCQVLLGTQVVGHLSLTDGQESLQFSYSDDWKKAGFALAPHLPLNGSISGNNILIFLENFLPEGQALEHLSIFHSISKGNVFALALAIRNDLTGALHLSLDTVNPSDDQIRVITEKEILERLTYPEQMPMDIWDGRPRLSIAGMQTKLNVFKTDDNWALVDGPNLSSTHILKFESSSQKHLLLNEFLTMQLAKVLGHPIANVQLDRIDNQRLLVIDRFDRKLIKKEGTLKVLRRYMIDGCQACGVSSSKKYERNFGDGKDVAHIREGVSFSKLFALYQYAQNARQFRENLFDWLVFNLLVGNSDAHGKNISFFVDRSGLSITPWYDLVSVQQIQNIEHSMAMAIGDEFDPAHLHSLQVLYEADTNGLPLTWATERFLWVLERLQGRLEELQLPEDLDNDEKRFFDSYRTFIEKRLALWTKEVKLMPELAADKSLF